MCELELGREPIGPMKHLRETLADSHIAAVAIAVLLFITLREVITVLLPVLGQVLGFILNALAIQDLPYYSSTIVVFTLSGTALYLCNAVIAFYAAWLLSQWVYHADPLATLRSYRTRFLRSTDV